MSVIIHCNYFPRYILVQIGLAAVHMQFYNAAGVYDGPCGRTSN